VRPVYGYTNRHCERLAGYTLSLGRALSLTDGEFEALRRGAVLHDVGKSSATTDKITIQS
jgi:HD-GYP domain-containing protein (c-di-GMP phosphodiesterase class II)